MNERTDAQAGLEKGIVRERQLQCEATYRNVVKLANAMSICEVPAGFDFTTAFNLLNAEIEHYRQILARKGISTGSNTGGSGGTTPTTPENPGTDTPGTDTPSDPGTDTPSDPGTGGTTTTPENPGTGGTGGTGDEG